MKKCNINCLKKKFVVILSLLLILSLMPISVLQSFAVSEEPIATLFFASDYQEKTGYGNPKGNLSALMDAVNRSGKGEDVDTAVFCGDFSSSYGDVTSYTSEVKALVNQKFPASTESVMLQGNHDNFNSDMKKTGAHEYDNYIVYVMNTKDANPWNQGAAGAKSTVQAAANNLQRYLNGLISSKDKRPVFIATHVPLHMSSRTSSKYGDVGDNMYSSYLFDVINEAGKNLDIVYLYGHNHSWGWDSYLGGSAVYRTKGDILPVPDCGGVSTAYTDKYTNEKLNFTYMNAGYVGYYSENTSPADDTLTCSVVEIYSDRMTVTRYDKDGAHKLGSQGSYNTSANNGAYNDTNGFPNGTTTGYSVVSSDTPSPQNIVRINAAEVSASLSLKGYSETAEIGSTANVRAVLSNATAVSYEWTTSDSSVAKLLETDKSAVRVEHNKKGSATITCTVTYSDDNGNPSTLTKSYTVTVNADVSSSSGTVYNKLTSLSDLTAGDGYLIIYKNKNLVTKVIQSGERTGLVADTTVSEAGNATITTSYEDSEWTLESAGSSGWYLKDGSKYLKLSKSSNYPASYQTKKSDGTAFSISKNGDYFNFPYNKGENMMQLSESRNLVYGYNKNGATTTDFYIYKKTTSSSGATATIKEANGSAVAAEYSKGTTQRFMADLTGIEEISSYSWSVGDSSIAELTDNDKASPDLKFRKAGETTLSLTIEYKSGTETKTVTDSVTIIVGEDQVDIKKGDRIITDVFQRRYGVGSSSTEVLSAYTHVNGTVESVEWASSNTSVATISSSGNNDATIQFTGSEGYTYITMTVRGTDGSGNPFTYVRGVTYYATPDAKSTSTGDYPEYPNEGAVAVDKYTESVDFATTGVTRVNLEIDGIAATKPQDVVFVVDMSSSMTKTVDGKKRVEVVNESLRDMIDVLLGDNTDGTASENRVAVVAFNNYDYTEINSDNTVSEFSPGGPESTSGFNHSEDADSKVPVISGLVGAEQKAALKQQIQKGCIDDNCASGTNYDLGLQEAYKILADAKSSSPDYDRTQTVIFMSDGAPYQYNYFRGYSGNGAEGMGEGWMAWINGNDSYADIATLLANNTYARKYFNTDGKNYWAEAIKSKTNGNKVIDPYNGSAAYYIREVDGLGATIYSIGFCLVADAEVTLEQERQTLSRVSGSTSRTYFADNAADLSDVFSSISNELLPAATDTLVEDRIGAAYDMQYSNTVTVGENVIDLKESKYIGEAPYMEVFTTDLADDRSVKADSKKSVEKVTFTTDSSGNITGATSTALSGNIYSGGKVNAKYFTLDTETEIITWNAGTILGSKRYNLSYYVSLNGAADGTREAGSYATNKSAIISYKNYLGNTCTMDFPVPYMAWKAANITYEFYLVNDKGQPVNRDGAVVNFEQRVTFFTETYTVNLNSNNEAKAQLLAQEKLPVGYELFNSNTAYYVNIGSGSNASSSYVSDTGTQTTFVWRPSGAEYDESNFTYDGRTYNLKVNGLADYANTHVAFAVVSIPEFVERSVTKVWDDDNNKNNVRPDSVEVQLYADGEVCGNPVTLNADNSWSYTWNNLYKYQYNNGVATESEVNYTVEETPVAGYTPAITENNGVFEIINSYGLHSLRITKENESGTKLKGAGFRVYKDVSCEQPADIFLDEALSSALGNAQDADLRTGDDGTLMFYGLKPGTYYIKEFRTPDGYTLLEDVLTLDIADGGQVSVTNSDGTYPATVDDNNVINLTITNRQLVIDVPFAAGTGIYIFLIGSMALMTAVVVLLTLKIRSTHS